jgi:hypothetical protein
MSIGQRFTKLFWNSDEETSARRLPADDEAMDAELLVLANQAAKAAATPTTKGATKDVTKGVTKDATNAAPARPTAAAPAGPASPLASAKASTASGAATRSTSSSTQARPTTSLASPAAATASPPPSSTENAHADLDFASVYTRTQALGDPKADQVLSAFEGMKAAMPPPQLALAMNVTAKAIGADRAAILETLQARLAAIDAAVVEQQTQIADRRAARAAELDAATQKVQAEITTMEQKIASLTKHLAAATDSLQQKSALESERLAAFDEQAREQVARLVALRDFLSATPNTP